MEKVCSKAAYIAAVAAWREKLEAAQSKLAYYQELQGRIAERAAAAQQTEVPQTETPQTEASQTPQAEANVSEGTSGGGVRLSDEVDENGHPFILADDGTTIFGEITDDTGLPSAPIKLSDGIVDENGNGYGLQHIEARHGEQIRNAGFKSVEDFVKYVAKNYDKDNIKVGKKRENGSGTFIIQIEDKHSNLLYIELSRDGSYWNVNRAQSLFSVGKQKDWQF